MSVEENIQLISSRAVDTFQQKPSSLPLCNWDVCIQLECFPSAVADYPRGRLFDSQSSTTDTRMQMNGIARAPLNSGKFAD